MSWRNNLKLLSEQDSQTLGSYSLTDSTSSARREFDFLISQIGDRDVVVDACLPPQLVRDLRVRNLNAVWVPSMLGDGASDEEIERQLLICSSTSEKRERVLLTRDVEFYRKIRKKAILVSFKAARFTTRTRVTNETLRREIRRIIKFRNDMAAGSASRRSEFSCEQN